MAEVAGQERPWISDPALPRPYDSGRTAEYRRQLGEDLRSAGYKLSRRLLLEYARRLGLGDCLRCGKPIEGDRYDLDHIEQWIDSDDPQGLYWDLGNVRLSHPVCNRQAQRRWLQRQGSDGTLRCCGCQEFKPESDYYVVARTGKPDNYCKKCRSARGAEWKRRTDRTAEYERLKAERRAAGRTPPADAPPHAPWGFNEDGTPKAPWGYRRDGVPRKKLGRPKQEKE